MATIQAIGNAILNLIGCLSIQLLMTGLFLNVPEHMLIYFKCETGIFWSSEKSTAIIGALFFFFVFYDMLFIQKRILESRRRPDEIAV